jgi:hypothetical protein
MLAIICIVVILDFFAYLQRDLFKPFRRVKLLRTATPFTSAV